MGLCEQLEFATLHLKLAKGLKNCLTAKKCSSTRLSQFLAKTEKGKSFRKKSLLPKQFELFSSLAGEKMTVLMITAITPFRLTRSRHVIISEKSN